ncbi:hypothetical protein VTJ83DRAFT_5341 [Remersonia thermophila]|uniref:Zn(2)-C6 fungal-type domain-containing protein n=1 Tax=Remersonia thermophila TaxID=72144 RepID=A0ABR4D6K4_9PEZI
MSGLDANRTANTRPAPYGRACTSCARAKCKCFYRLDGNDCERCHRLKKECIPSVSIRKRNGKKTHVSRTAQLEAKLEDLVSLLRHRTGPVPEGTPSHDASLATTGPTTPAWSTQSSTTQSEYNSPQPTQPSALPPYYASSLPPPPPPQNPSNSHDRGGGGGGGGGACPPPLASVPTAGATTNPPTANGAAPLTSPIPACVYVPDPVEAAAYLDTFRKYYLIFLPFVHLPATMTSEKLRDAYPFLWFAIMTVTCKHADRRLAMSDALKRFLAQKMVVDHEKSLDLLLGLVIIMGWTHYHIKGDKSILSVMASLAKSLVFDLGLNKVPSEPYISACLKTPFHPPAREKTQEERRAVLACFLLTSQISYAIKRLDSLTWTSHMDECLVALTQHREWDGDDLLAAQVKIQLIIEQLTRAAAQSPDGVPPNYVLSALRTQLHNHKAQLPPHLQQNDTILSAISYADLAIHELAMTRPNPAPAPASSLMRDMQRYEALEACLTAASDWFDRHFSIPSYVYVGMTFGSWWNMAHCLLTLYRLSVLDDDPAWDCRAVRKRLDLLAVLDRLEAGFQETAAARRLAAGLTVEEDIFGKFARFARSMRASWGSELAARGAAAGVAPPPPPPPPPPGDVAVVVNQTGVPGAEGGLCMTFLQQDDSEAWIAGLFDMNWEV